MGGFLAVVQTLIAALLHAVQQIGRWWVCHLCRVIVIFISYVIVYLHVCLFFIVMCALVMLLMKATYLRTSSVIVTVTTGVRVVPKG